MEKKKNKWKEGCAAEGVGGGGGGGGGGVAGVSVNIF